MTSNQATFAFQTPGRVLPSHVQKVVEGPARRLVPSTLHTMNTIFAHDFSGVRLHDDVGANRSAGMLNAAAYTIGNDIVWGAPVLDPAGYSGRRLLRHELSHVVQQDRGGTAPPSSSDEHAAERAEGHSGSSSVSVEGASTLGIAPAPLSLSKTLIPADLSVTALDREIEEIQTYLDESAVTSVENDSLLEQQAQLQAERARRRRAESGPPVGRRNSKTASPTPVAPRSMSESILIDDKLSDADLNGEIDAIHAALPTSSRSNRTLLNVALAPLVQERQRRDRVQMAQQRAEKIQRAFAPSVTATDGEALVEVMRAVDEIAPSSTTSGEWIVNRNGEFVAISDQERASVLSNVRGLLTQNLRRVRSKAETAKIRYDAQVAINKDQWIVAGVVHFFGGVDDPGPEMFQAIESARVNADSAEILIARGNFARASAYFATSERFATQANRMSYRYVDELIGTAETTVTVLEITRDVAVAATLALGAAVAAPAVAAYGAGLGITGAAGATAFTTVGTGVVVGAGGAALRGVPAAAGVALTGGSLSETGSALATESWRGAKEGIATGAGGGFARSAATVLKVGSQATRSANIARSALAQGSGGAVGSGSGKALDGGDLGDVAKSSAIGFGIGTITGPLSDGAGLIKSAPAAAGARFGVGSVASGTQAYLETQDVAASIRAAGTGGTAALIGGLGQPARGQSQLSDRAFAAGAATRRTVGLRGGGISNRISTETSGAKISPPSASPSSDARSIADVLVAKSGQDVRVNIGGTGAPHEPQHAINLNPQVPGTERLDIPNHVPAHGEDIGSLFAPSSVSRVEGHHLPPGVLDWAKVAPGSFAVLKPGGQFEIYFRGSHPDAQACARELSKAGFVDVKVQSDVLISGRKPTAGSGDAQ